jgi:hypothetical protein
MPPEQTAPPLHRDSAIQSAEQLKALAFEVVETDLRGSASTRLKAAIDQILASRDDPALAAAYSMIDDEAVLAELQAWVDDASQNVELFVGWNGADPRPSEAMLFAIPVILGTLPGEEGPAEIPAVEHLVESLGRHGLVGSHPGVYLASEFLRLPDVEVLPSCRRLLLQCLVTRYFGGNFGALPGRGLAETGEWSAMESDFPRLSLGFLAGAVLFNVDAEERPFYPDATHADEYDDRCQAWSVEASAWLEQQTGHGFALAVPPEILSDAIKNGIDEFRATALTIAAKATALAAAGGSAQCHAELDITHAGTPSAGVRITLHGGGAVNEYTWPWWPFDDQPAMMELILGVLEEEGIRCVETFGGKARSSLEPVDHDGEAAEPR